MRTRPLPVVGAIVVAAALATWLVARLPVHGRPGAPADVAAPPPATPERLGRLEGMVRGADGRPEAGAVIVAASAAQSVPGASGADGRFALEVPAGSWRLHASLGERAGAAGPIASAAGATRGGLELRLGPAAEIRGEAVHAASGRPAAGARVVAFAHETRGVLAQAVADAAGRFRLAGLAAGPVDVRADAERASAAPAVGVTLEPGARFPLRLALVAVGSATGVVKDAAGRPLEGLRVRVVRRGEGAVPAEAHETRTDPDGAWRIDGLESGPVEVSVREEGALGGASQALRIAPGRVTRADLAVPEAGYLSGRVGREAEPPPPGTAVLATPMRAGLAPEIARAAVDRAGHYRIALPAGEYRVLAAPPDARRADLRASPRFARVVPGRAAALDLEAPRAAAEEGVELRVLEPDGTPSGGAAVTLARPDDAAVAFATSAGEDGRVAIGRDLGVAGRRVVVRARKEGRTGTASLVLPPAGVVTVSLAPAGAVKGVVRARGGRPIEGLTVECASEPEPGGWRARDVHRFAGARFELADLPAGPLRISVRTDDGRRGAASLTLAAGEVRTLEIALAP